MVSVPCPLRECDSVHEVRLDRSGNPFVACKAWRNSIWFRGVGESYLNANNGGAIRANPSDGPTVFEQRARDAGLNDPPDSMEDAESPEPEPSHPRTLAEKFEELARLRRARLLRERGIDPDEGT